MGLEREYIEAEFRVLDDSGKPITDFSTEAKNTQSDRRPSEGFFDPDVPYQGRTPDPLTTSSPASRRTPDPLTPPEPPRRLRPL
jgi:hypothetical protein